MNASLDPRHLLDAPLASTRALPHGTRIQHFEIVRSIAETNLGIDYLAIDHTLHAEVVLKEYLPSRLARREGMAMRPHVASDAAKLAIGLQAFVAEPRLRARTEHPALASVIDIVQANDTAYHVMSHGGGTPLLQLRREMNVAPDERTLRALLDDLLGALEALHHDGVVHGAVSPDHILLLADDRPLLLGPEPARAEPASGLIELLMASVAPAFAAPEQRDASLKQAPTPATDLYSLAETMRFCISGELPPRAGNPAASGLREPMLQTVRRLFGDGPTPRYSASLLGTLDAALDADPLMRPQSAAEFRDALGSAPAPAAPVRDATAPPIAPRDAPDAARTARAAAAPHMAFRPPRKRSRGSRSVWTGAALALLLVAGAYGWWWFDHAAPVGVPVAVATPSADAAVAPVPLAPPPVAENTVIERRPPPVPPTPRGAVALSLAKAKPATAAVATSPRESCGDRTPFALYRCMQTLCEQRGWSKHPQCERLRTTDNVE